MNPLSAIRPYTLPELRPPAALLGNAGAAGIPSTELGALTPPVNLPPVTGAEKPVASFSGVLGRFVNEIGDKQRIASEAVTGLINGQNIPLHQVITAGEEASLAFTLMVEVRNKLLESYQELMRMQV